MIQSVKLKLSEVMPNPHRNFDLNPLDENKVETLVSSIQTAGFWTGVIVRQREDGRYEQAFGHHRIAAAKRVGIKDYDFILEDLTDSQMLERMALDNSEDYASNVLSVVEAVEAMVKGLSNGIIPAFEISPNTPKQHIRYAPSYTPGVNLPHEGAVPYTTDSISKRLGYSKEKGAAHSVTAALGALQLIQLGLLKARDIKGLSSRTLYDMVNTSLKRYEQAKINTAKDDVEKQRLREQQLKLEKERKDAEAKAREESERLRKVEREAREQRDLEAAKQAAEERKVREDRAAARDVQFKVARAALDKKIEVANERSREVEKENKDLPTRHAVKNLLFKLDTIASEGYALRQEVQVVARNKGVTLKERDLLYKAMQSAGNWFFQWAGKFAVEPPHVYLKGKKGRTK